MNLSIPLNFGERPCDRALLANLPLDARDAAVRGHALWMALLVWKDFGIARDDRRIAPLCPTARMRSQTTAIIEQFIGYTGEQGTFVEAALQAGFFSLVPVDEENGDLVLVDFFPANHTAARDITNSKLGGISKGINIARRDAMARSKEQLGLFESTKSEVLKTHGKERVKDALFLVHQVCRILGRQPPVAAEWKEALIIKASTVLDAHTEAELEVAFKWFAANRNSQEVPPRIDLILERFSEFVTKGRRDFK